MPLTKRQASFLIRHGFEPPDDWALDATGRTRDQWREMLRAEGKLFAYGLVACPRGRHTMRTKGGCPECDPATIAYAARADQAGFVYIAKAGPLTKVGFSKDPTRRLRLANCVGYGSEFTWKLRAQAYSPRAGRLEISLKKCLAPFAVDLDEDELRAGAVATEVFKCSYRAARESLDLLLGPCDYWDFETRR